MPKAQRNFEKSSNVATKIGGQLKKKLFNLDSKPFNGPSFWYPIHRYYHRHEDERFHHWSQIPNQAHCTLFGSLQSPIKGMEGSLGHHLTLNWGKKLWNFTIINKAERRILLAIFGSKLPSVIIRIANLFAWWRMMNDFEN